MNEQYLNKMYYSLSISSSSQQGILFNFRCGKKLEATTTPTKHQGSSKWNLVILGASTTSISNFQTIVSCLCLACLAETVRTEIRLELLHLKICKDCCLSCGQSLGQTRPRSRPTCNNNKLFHILTFQTFSVGSDLGLDLG